MSFGRHRQAPGGPGGCRLVHHLAVLVGENRQWRFFHILLFFCQVADQFQGQGSEPDRDRPPRPVALRRHHAQTLTRPLSRHQGQPQATPHRVGNTHVHGIQQPPEHLDLRRRQSSILAHGRGQRLDQVAGGGFQNIPFHCPIEHFADDLQHLAALVRGPALNDRFQQQNHIALADIRSLAIPPCWQHVLVKDLLIVAPAAFFGLGVLLHVFLGELAHRRCQQALLTLLSFFFHRIDAVVPLRDRRPVLVAGFSQRAVGIDPQLQPPVFTAGLVDIVKRLDPAGSDP